MEKLINIKVCVRTHLFLSTCHSLTHLLQQVAGEDKVCQALVGGIHDVARDSLPLLMSFIDEDDVLADTHLNDERVGTGRFRKADGTCLRQGTETAEAAEGTSCRFLSFEVESAMHPSGFCGACPDAPDPNAASSHSRCLFRAAITASGRASSYDSISSTVIPSALARGSSSVMSGYVLSDSHLQIADGVTPSRSASSFCCI